MVSTYLSYDLVNRDLFKTLQRVASQDMVARDAAYYAENIGKITSVEEFVNDYRLFSYAMKAHGLEEMTYAKAFMKKVLESDLSDPNSYANLLTDDRYKNFAAAFNFSGSSTPIAQSAAQQEEILELYDQSILAAQDHVAEETRYYQVMIEQVDHVDDILRNDRLRRYVFEALGIDDSVYSYDTVRKAMSSDKNDPASYTNTVLKDQLQFLANKVATAQAELSELGTDPEQHVEEKASLKREIEGYQKALMSTQAHIDLAGAFEFAADGTSAKGAAQTAEQLTAVTDLYLLSRPRQTQASALRERDYFEEKIKTITTVDQLVDDPRLYDYVRKAFNLNELYIVKSTIEQILTNHNNIIEEYAKERPQYKELYEAFNFKADGTLDGAVAQTYQQTKMTSQNYFNRYDDKQEEEDEKAIKLYKSEMAAVKSVEDFLSDRAIYGFALQAVGLDPDTVSLLTLKNVLKSDLSDPKSYVYRLKDDRYLTLAQAFNFTKDGGITGPVQAQSAATITETGKAYIVQQTRFLEGDEKEAARKKADEESSYYTETMSGIKTLDEFLKDRRLVDFVLTAKGLDPSTVTDDFLKQLFASDLDDPDSFVNQQANREFAELLGSFNFDENGNLDRDAPATIQGRGKVLETQNLYLRQTLEIQQGEENAGVRLALYFERMADTITDAYGILGDEALMEFFRITFSLPTEIGSMDIDQQAKIVEEKLDLNDLKDPEKIGKLVQRFTILYDLESGVTGPSPVDILTGSGAYTGISADTLWALSQVRR